MITHFQRHIHRHGKWVFSILLFIILVAFVLWDYAGTVRRDRQESTIKVYGRRISPRDLDLAQRLTMLNLTLMSGQEMRMNDRARTLVQRQTLQRMALAEKARRMGLSVEDDEVVREVQRWFTKDGQFNQAAYSQFLSDALGPRRLTEADFEGMVRQDILLRKLLRLVGSTAKVTDAQVADFARELLQRLTVAVCRFNAADELAAVKPSDADLMRFYKDKPDLFRTPDRVRVAYVAFPVDPAKVTVTDQDLQEAYEANRSIFTTPDGKVKPFKEVADVLRHEVPRRKAMQQALAQATEFTVRLVAEPGKATPSFQELAREKGLAVKETGFFSANEPVPGILTPEFAAAAQRLGEDNPVSDPLPGDNAVHVLRLLERQPSVLPPFEKVRDAVRNACATDMALRLAREAGSRKRGEVLALLQGGKTFEQALAELKLKPALPPAFTQAEAPPRDPMETAIRHVAGTLPAGTVSEFVPTPTGGFFVGMLSRQEPKPDDVTRLIPQVRQVLIESEQQQVLQAFQADVVKEAMGRLPIDDSVPPSEN